MKEPPTFRSGDFVLLCLLGDDGVALFDEAVAIFNQKIEIELYLGLLGFKLGELQFYELDLFLEKVRLFIGHRGLLEMPATHCCTLKRVGASQASFDLCDVSREISMPLSAGTEALDLELGIGTNVV